jgi:hypothetical protein
MDFQVTKREMAMIVSRNVVPRPRRLLGGRAAGAALAVLGGMAAVTIGFRGPETSHVGLLIKCAARVIVVDTLSSNRSPVLSNFANRVINVAAQSAVVCNEPLSVYGVAGGGSESTIITTDDLSGFTPIGPTAQIRSLRFNAARRSALDILVSARLRAAYDTGTPSLTSVPALYWVASEYLRSPSHWIPEEDDMNNADSGGSTRINPAASAETISSAQLPHVDYLALARTPSARFLPKLASERKLVPSISATPQVTLSSVKPSPPMYCHP